VHKEILNEAGISASWCERLAAILSGGGIFRTAQCSVNDGQTNISFQETLGTGTPHPANFLVSPCEILTPEFKQECHPIALHHLHSQLSKRRLEHNGINQLKDIKNKGRLSSVIM
jgi:hypothetical protein